MNGQTQNSLKAFLCILSVATGLSAAMASTAQAQEDLRVPECQDIHGQAVGFAAIKDTSHGPAYSTVYNNKPMIFFNWPEMHKYSTSVDTDRFIFEHECGHCALGHIYFNATIKKTNQDELAADCFAAKQARKLGLDIQNVIKDVDLLPRDPSHPSGLVRAKNILKCYNQ